MFSAESSLGTAAQLDKAVSLVQMHVVAIASPKVPVRKCLRVAQAVNVLAR
jgi:hypothetical protein